MSNFETLVSSILSAASIEYITEYKLSALRAGLYRFDFYLPKQNVFIECNGIQHYTFVKAFYKNRSDFLKAQERDRRKCSYCLAHDYKLYCIPYWDMEKLHTTKDLFKSQYLVTSKFHNDIVWQAYQKSKVE